MEVLNILFHKNILHVQSVILGCGESGESKNCRFSIKFYCIADEECGVFHVIKSIAGLAIKFWTTWSQSSLRNANVSRNKLTSSINMYSTTTRRNIDK